MLDETDLTTHERVLFSHDRASGLRAIIAIHDTTLGPGLGGVRMYPYSSVGHALRDVLDLSRAMTLKAALAGVDLGGGKSVIIGDPEVDKSDALLAAMGRLIESVGGRYVAGIDSGTTQRDLRVIGQETQHVSCIGDDPSIATAAGVYAAIRSGLRFLDGSADLAGRRVAIQGIGHVGSALARMLAADGAELVISDVRREAALALAGELGAAVVDPDKITAVPCDVFAPCALGGAVDERTLAVLSTRLVAGAANNVLADPAQGQELHRRGILYAPDYCANAGGIIFLAEEGNGTRNADTRVAAIGHTLTAIWQRSREQGVAPELVADDMAWERIRARKGPDAASTGSNPT